MGLPSLDEILQKARAISDATGESEEMPVDSLSWRFKAPSAEVLQALAVNRELAKAHSLARNAWLQAKAERKFEALDDLIEAEMHLQEANRLRSMDRKQFAEAAANWYFSDISGRMPMPPM